MRAYVRKGISKEQFALIGIARPSTRKLLDGSMGLFNGEFRVLDETLQIFVFSDARLPKWLWLPAARVSCEVHEMEPNTTMSFMSCKNCKEGIQEGLDNLPEEPDDLYT